MDNIRPGNFPRTGEHFGIACFAEINPRLLLFLQKLFDHGFHIRS
jgi:hypothetical protein